MRDNRKRRPTDVHEEWVYNQTQPRTAAKILAERAAKDRQSKAPVKAAAKLKPYVNRNWLNYPLARSPWTAAEWYQDGLKYCCKLPGEDRIELTVPLDAPENRRRCPTPFDINVLFRLFDAAQSAKGKWSPLRFSTFATVLRDLKLTDHSDNRTRFTDTLGYWRTVSIRFATWLKGKGNYIEQDWPPPLKSIKWEGYGVEVELSETWEPIVLLHKYVAHLPLPLPADATVQNAVLLVVTHDKLKSRLPPRFQRSAFCRKIGLRSESSGERLDRVIERANEWLAETGLGHVIKTKGNSIEFKIKQAEQAEPRTHSKKRRYKKKRKSDYDDDYDCSHDERFMRQQDPGTWDEHADDV
jgi:hypothetical protein